jgi:3-hydroxyacyl-[acyl-carrier-protein] dehydratase
MVLDFEGVRGLLPQSYPFIFVDRVLDFEAKRRIVCLKNVTGNEPFFAGHFPEIAIMPGALMGEGIAQASILLFRLSEEASPEAGGRIFLVGTTRTRFIQPVFPGDSLRITVNVAKLFSKSAMVKGIVEVDGRTVVKSTVTLAAVRPEELRGHRPQTRQLGVRSATP